MLIGKLLVLVGLVALSSWGISDMRIVPHELEKEKLRGKIRSLELEKDLLEGRIKALTRSI